MSPLATTTPHRARLAAGAVTAALLLPLTACSAGSDSVSCSGTTCTATLTGKGTQVTVLGTQVGYSGTQGGRATLAVGDRSVSCATGEGVSAGPLRLTCTSVTDDGVELSASVG